MLPHTRGGPLYRTLYACRSTAGPAHCTLTARLRLHGPCYRAKVHGTCTDRADRGISLSPSRSLRRLRRLLGSRLSRSPLRVDRTSDMCRRGRSPAVHTAPPGQQSPRRSASVRHACAEQPYRLPAIGSRASSACATAKLMWPSACATLPPATHAALLARHKAYAIPPHAAPHLRRAATAYVPSSGPGWLHEATINAVVGLPLIGGAAPLGQHMPHRSTQARWA